MLFVWFIVLEIHMSKKSTLQFYQRVSNCSDCGFVLCNVQLNMSNLITFLEIYVYVYYTKQLFNHFPWSLQDPIQ